MVFRPVLRSQVLFDVIVAVLLGVVLLLLRTAGWAPLDVVIVAGLTVSLALRRLSPGLALGIAWAFAVLQMATGLGRTRRTSSSPA